MTNSLRVGFDYDIYRMELVAPLVYLLIKVRSFYIPRSTYDLTVALTTIPTLLQLQQLTCNQVSKARRNIVSAESEQCDWTRSFDYLKINFLIKKKVVYVE